MDTKAIKFNPTVEKLTSAVEVSKKIVVSDLRDLKQIQAVKETRKELRKFEIVIEKDGLKFREEAKDWAKEVIRQEKELKKITSPEIERLKEIEDKSEAVLLKDKRIKSLPDKKERLEAIGDDIKVEDDFLLNMEDLGFVAYLNERVADKNEADRVAEEERAEKARIKVQEEQEAKEKKLEDEKEALRIKGEEAQAKIDKANEELAQKNKEAQDKIDEANRKIDADKLDLQHKKELQEADDRAKKDAEEKQEADRLKAVEDKKAEDDKLKKRKAYIKFLSDNGYTEKTKDNYTIIKSEAKIVLYKKVGEFEL